VVERGDLGDHPADADARQVRRPVVEFAGERRGVGCEIAQRVRRSLGSTVVDAPDRAGRTARRGARRARAPSQSASGQESMVVPPASRTSGAAASPKCSTPSVTPFAWTVVIMPRPLWPRAERGGAMAVRTLALDEHVVTLDPAVRGEDEEVEPDRNRLTVLGDRPPSGT
jgi:hypothetical protein